MRGLPDPGPLVIVGAGGFGRECLDVVDALNEAGATIDVRGFLDDGPVDVALLDRLGVPLIGPTAAATPDLRRFVIGIGNGAVRSRIDDDLVHGGLSATTLIHPSVTIGSLVTIGDGSVLCAGARLTTNIELGRHVHVNLNSTIGHDAVVDDYVTIFPAATISGNVRLGRGVTVGTGANVLPGVRIGEGAFVGAGAVVARDVEAGTTVVGVPARPLQRPDDRQHSLKTEPGPADR